MATHKRTWYCCIIVQFLALGDRMNARHFRQGQHGYVAQLDEAGEEWMLFDGRRYAAVLLKAQAKAALETRRDREGKPVLAPKDTERRFLRSVYGQTGMRVRQDRHRFW